MELRQLECFLACVRNRSLTLAAEEMYMTQPHVSMIIKSLEQELGVQLFYRKAKGVELTEEGKRIYTYAVNTVKNAQTIEGLCSEKAVPYLRIATNPSSHMAMLLTDYYRQAHRDGMAIEYTECGIEEMLTRISAGECDLGFLFVPDDRRYGRKSISPEELLDLRFVQLKDDFFSVEDILEESEVFRKKKCHLPKVVNTNSGHMMIQMLQNTDLCNIGSYWLSDLYRRYDFGRIPIRGYEDRITFGYLKYSRKTLLPQMEDFLDFLKVAVAKDSEKI